MQIAGATALDGSLSRSHVTPDSEAGVHTLGHLLDAQPRARSLLVHFVLSRCAHRRRRNTRLRLPMARRRPAAARMAAAGIRATAGSVGGHLTRGGNGDPMG